MSYLKQTTKMGTWKKRKVVKGLRASRTHSGMGKTYVAIPPPEGWPGGFPDRNGLKGRKG